MRRQLAGAVAALILLVSCTSNADGPEGPTLSTGPVAPLGDPAVELETVASLEQPVALAVRPDDPALYVAEKTGQVVALVDGQDPEVVLDLSGVVSRGSEQGLLGIAFSPDGSFLYADLTDAAGTTRLFEFRVSPSGEVDPDWRQLLRVAQPYSNHNGGALAFGPDGFLYISLGDGGSGGDPHGNGQSLETLLGKILRISPRPGAGEPYTIPPDNPFVGRADALPEIWAYGLRNPWRLSFDRETGDLWIGDVGQGSWEEIDVDPAGGGGGGGANFGWNAFEGGHRFSGGLSEAETVPPVYEYPHDGTTCAVTGGYVYRGGDIPALVGAYVFADFCEGGLMALRLQPGREPEVIALGPAVENLASFGEDADGELYALSLSGDFFRLVPSGG